jgi:hypothetical protein
MSAIEMEETMEDFKLLNMKKYDREKEISLTKISEARYVEMSLI